MASVLPTNVRDACGAAVRHAAWEDPAADDAMCRILLQGSETSAWQAAVAGSAWRWQAWLATMSARTHERAHEHEILRGRLPVVKGVGRWYGLS